MMMGLPGVSSRMLAFGVQAQASFEAHALGGSRFGIELSNWVDANGAHAFGAMRCLLVDPGSGRIVEPTQLIDDDQRSALTKLVTRKLLAQSNAKSMTDLNGGSKTWPEDAPVTDQTDVCMTERGVDVSFEAYEIGPYALGAPRISLTRAEARPFFVKDELIQSVLR